MPQVAQQDYIRIYSQHGVDVPSDEQKKQMADCFDAGTIFDVVIEDGASMARIITATKNGKLYIFEYVNSGEIIVVEYERP